MNTNITAFVNKDTKRKLRLLGKFLIAAGILMLLFLLFTSIYNNYQQRRLAQVWEQKQRLAQKQPVRRAVSSQTKAEPPPPNSDLEYYKELKEKGAFAKLVISKIGLDVIVVEGVTPEALKQGPGHMPGTALPGELGNTVISGHRVTYGAPFYRLDELENGDLITLYTPTQKFKYIVVEKKVVSPSDVSVTKPTEEAMLTLTTCEPRYSARQRLIIRAKLLSSPRFPSGGRF